MPVICDLMPCTALAVMADHLLAVGWLGDAFDFSSGPIAREVYSRLSEFARNPWQPSVAMGYHSCGLCQFEPEKSGAANLYFPHEGQIYVCPELITHYINAHHYAPPEVFCDAVLACPPMNSMDYKRLLIACRGQCLWQTPTA